MNLSAIRTVRVLRPLRAINRIPSKQRIEQHNYTHTQRQNIIIYLLIN